MRSSSMSWTAGIENARRGRRTEAMSCSVSGSTTGFTRCCWTWAEERWAEVGSELKRSSVRIDKHNRATRISETGRVFGPYG